MANRTVRLKQAHQQGAAGPSILYRTKSARYQAQESLRKVVINPFVTGAPSDGKARPGNWIQTFIFFGFRYLSAILSKTASYVGEEN